MIRPMLAILLAILAATTPASPARAGWSWCRADPVVTIGGTTVDISVAIPEEYLPAAVAADGAIRFDVRTPKGVARQLVLRDLGYNLQAAEVAFSDGSGSVTDGLIPTRVVVQVPIEKSLLSPGEEVPVELTVFPLNGEPVVVRGTSGRTVIDLTILGQESPALLDTGGIL
jgi:hypothetical protein